MIARVARSLVFAVCCAGYAVPGWSAVLTQKFTVPIPRDFTAQPFPLFENGFVLAYDFNRALVWSYDRHGEQLMQVQLAVPNATSVRIHNVAAALDGTLAVAGSASDNQGHIVPVIFWVSSVGAITRIVRTEPFSASRVAFAPDGSLWAAGRVYSFNASNPPASQFQIAGSYDVLRHYDVQGQLQHTAVPRTSFATSTGDPASESFLAVGKDRIVFLSVTAKEYVEVSLAGQILGQWAINSPIPANTIRGIALTLSATVFVSTVSHADPGVPYQGPPVYQFDKSSGVLTPAQLATTAPTRPTLLLGSDGDDLVFYSKPPASVSWFTVQ